MTRVVDASAIGAMLFNEEAAVWVQDETFGELLIAPLLFHFELGNLCWKKLRQFPDQAAAMHKNWMSWNGDCPVNTVDTDLGETMELARGHSLTFYDASYLCLAKSRSADLVSLDARLVRAARSLGLNAPSPQEGGHNTPRSRN
jgi:predicted nucleic acid-binding protein